MPQSKTTGKWCRFVASVLGEGDSGLMVGLVIMCDQDMVKTAAVILYTGTGLAHLGMPVAAIESGMPVAVFGSQDALVEMVFTLGE
jgi:hypothetical protein